MIPCPASWREVFRILDMYYADAQNQIAEGREPHVVFNKLINFNMELELLLVVLVRGLGLEGLRRYENLVCDYMEGNELALFLDFEKHLNKVMLKLVCEVAHLELSILTARSTLISEQKFVLEFQKDSNPKSATLLINKSSVCMLLRVEDKLAEDEDDEQSFVDEAVQKKNKKRVCFLRSIKSYCFTDDGKF